LVNNASKSLVIQGAESRSTLVVQGLPAKKAALPGIPAAPL